MYVNGWELFGDMRVVVLDSWFITIENILLYENCTCMFELSIAYLHLFIDCCVYLARITYMTWVNEVASGNSATE